MNGSKKQRLRFRWNRDDMYKHPLDEINMDVKLCMRATHLPSIGIHFGNSFRFINQSGDHRRSASSYSKFPSPTTNSALPLPGRLTTTAVSFCSSVSVLMA